jgi:hypothetical protein
VVRDARGRIGSQDVLDDRQDHAAPHRHVLTVVCVAKSMAACINECMFSKWGTQLCSCRQQKECCMGMTGRTNNYENKN